MARHGGGTGHPPPVENSAFATLGLPTPTAARKESWIKARENRQWKQELSHFRRPECCVTV